MSGKSDDRMRKRKLASCRSLATALISICWEPLSVTEVTTHTRYWPSLYVWRCVHTSVCVHGRHYTHTHLVGNPWEECGTLNSSTLSFWDDDVKKCFKKTAMAWKSSFMSLIIKPTLSGRAVQETPTSPGNYLQWVCDTLLSLYEHIAQTHTHTV